MQKRAIVLCASILAVAACVERASLRGRPCPCAVGWKCCSGQDICVPEAADCAALGSECAAPRPEWLFYSCWTTTVGASNQAVRDGDASGVKWQDYSGSLSVVDGPPAGGPSGENALEVQWSAYDPGTCSVSSNAFVRAFPDGTSLPVLPNPWYLRFYFYSEQVKSPLQSQNCNRKLIFTRNQTSSACTAFMELQNLPASDSALILIKTNVHPNEYTRNCRDCQEITSEAAWPGKEAEGIVTPNAWHFLEWGVYEDPFAGWYKVWLDGKLVIDADSAGFDSLGNPGTGYDTWYVAPATSSHAACNWIDIPSYREGGILADHAEYFSNVIISSSYIGPR